MSTEARTKLAAMQVNLVAALVGDATVPPGFDSGRLNSAAISLRTKRARAVARAWPCLRQEIGEHFAAFAANTPLPREGGPLADGRAFANWLEQRGKLPEAARLQMIAVDLRYVRKRDALTPRRGPCIKLMRLPSSKRLAVALRLPGLGEHWFSVPWSGSASKAR
jgi:hypothetical protein